MFLAGICQQGDVVHVPRSCLAARRYSQGLEMPLLPVHLSVTQLVLPNLKTTYGKLRRTCILIWGFSKKELKRNSGGVGGGRKNQISPWLPFSTVVILGWCLNGSCRAQDALWHLLAAVLFLKGKGAAIPSPAHARETFFLPLC